jgi:hypothetical protein
MRQSRPSIALRRLPGLALTLLAGCNPATLGDAAGGTGTGTGGASDKAAVITYTHVMMTSNTVSSSVGWRANGTQKGTGVVYLGSLVNDTVRFAGSSPLVTIEANNNGGSTRFLSEARTLVDGMQYRAFAYGVIGATDPNQVPNLLLAPYDTLTPPAGKAHVRFAHFMPGTGPVDIWTGPPGSEVKVVTALAYGEITAYGDVTAASALVPSINVTVTPTGVLPNAGTNLMSIVGVSSVISPIVYTFTLIYTQSNFGSPGARSLAIYQDR